MCGIFGAIDHRGIFSAPDLDMFRRLTDMVAYRGPDAAGYQLLNRKAMLDQSGNGAGDVFLGHRRLSILDLSEAGRQPMTDGRGRWLIFNGEIFNYLELRRELEQAGEVFTTQTDTEVILKIYARYGPQGFAQFNGMWAFALIDLQKRHLVLSRDRFSIKPLYYTRQGTRLYFASEVKQLLPLLPAKNLNEKVMSAFLAQLLLDHTSETFFEGIHRILPKTAMIVSLMDGNTTVQQYWDYQAEPVNGDFAESTQQFRELLEDSVRLRLRSDVKVGCLLSGGLDSSAIATLVHSLQADKIETFSVVSKDARYSEGAFVDQLTAATGMRNHKLPFDYPELLKVVSEVIAQNDEPVGGLSVAAQFSMFRLIKKHSDATVLLSGQGADEALCGYFKFFFFYLGILGRQGKIITASRELLASMFHGTVIRQFRLSEARRYAPYLNLKPYGGALRLGADYISAPIGNGDNVRQRQILDLDQYSVPALAHYEDRNSMAHSLEVRHPFLDHRLVNYAINLPAERKMKSGWTKRILRNAFPDLPDAIRWRRDKQGFLTAEEKWIRQDLPPLIEKLFTKSTLAEMGVVDDKQFLHYFAAYRRGKTAGFGDISRMFLAELWARNIFAGETGCVTTLRIA